MNTLHLEGFLKAVVYDHAIATGLKRCTTHAEIVAYANSQGFSVDLDEWQAHVDADWLTLDPAAQSKIRECETSHWSWAFRQTPTWRAMLME